MNTELTSGAPEQAEGIKLVAEQFGLDLVVLFGSRSGGRLAPRTDSDVDIAVLGCRREEFLACLDALAALFAHANVDLVRLEDADPLFRHEVLSMGQLVHGDPDRFAELRARAYREYVDSADLRALEAKLFERRMARLRGTRHAPP